MEKRRSPTTGKVTRNPSSMDLTTHWACPTCEEPLNSRTWGRHECEAADHDPQEEADDGA